MFHHKNIVYLLVFFLLGKITLASTDVSGTISSNTTWDSSGDGIYRVVGDITVNSGVTLTLQSGVQVHYTGNYRILINGTLDAQGTISDSILFKHETNGNNHYSIDFNTSSASCVMKYCRIQDGIADGTGGLGVIYGEHGGGILIYDSAPTIENCTIQNNSAIYGGGIFVLGNSSAIVKSNIIKNNNGSTLGGGIGLNGTNSNAEIVNNLIYDNTAGSGGGISVYNNMTTTLINNLVFNNSSNGEGGGLRIHRDNNTITIRNCVFWNNSATSGTNADDQLSNQGSGNTLTVEYSDVELSSGTWSGTGNINSDPNFLDATYNDFHLSPGSPCIDVGTSTGAPSTDFDENATAQDGNNTVNTPENDMGAFEFLQEVYSFSSSTTTNNYSLDTYEAGSSNQIATVTLNGTVTGSGNITVNCFTKSMPLNAPSGSEPLTRWYRITESGDLSYSNTDLRLYYGDDENLTNKTESNLSLWRYNGSAWVNMSGTATPASNYVTVSGISASNLSGDWAFSDPSDHPLPVTLNSLTTVSGDEQVTLKWSTASEIDNQGFIVLRSDQEDGGFMEIASYEDTPSLKGAGNSSANLNYNYTDYHLFNGQTYWYKLADVDFNGNRVYHGPLSATPLQSELDRIDLNIPETWALSQNYPNPFNPSTKINFDVPSLSEDNLNVQINIFDMRGKKVKKLFIGTVVPGSYKVEWDGTNSTGNHVVSGMYFYQLYSSAYVITKKMILMR